MMMFSAMPLAVLAIAVQGKPLLELEPRDFLQDLSIYGVDAELCKRMVYQVKGCWNHDIFLLDSDGKQLVQFIIGGWYNKRSQVSIFPTSKVVTTGTANVLHCDEFRWFWMSWDAGRIKYGEGRVPGEDAIWDLEDPTGGQVKRFALKKYSLHDITVRFGDTEGGRFSRVLEKGKFYDGMISETSTLSEMCLVLCFEHVDCGMFSYNQDLGLCAIFDRMTSSFNVTTEEGWRSWKLLYCYP